MRSFRAPHSGLPTGLGDLVGELPLSPGDPVQPDLEPLVLPVRALARRADADPGCDVYALDQRFRHCTQRRVTPPGWPRRASARAASRTSSPPPVRAADAAH